jgi:hypothetical protein
MNLSELARQMLRRGIEDWVQMAEVAAVARGTLPSASPDEVREQCVRAIGELRDGGFARVGGLVGDTFTMWSGETSSVLHRIDSEWRALGTPKFGQIGWLENTPVGNRIGLNEWEKWHKRSENASDQ